MYCFLVWGTSMEETICWLVCYFTCFFLYLKHFLKTRRILTNGFLNCDIYMAWLNRQRAPPTERILFHREVTSEVCLMRNPARARNSSWLASGWDRLWARNLVVAHSHRNLKSVSAWGNLNQKMPLQYWNTVFWHHSSWNMLTPENADNGSDVLHLGVGGEAPAPPEVL